MSLLSKIAPLPLGLSLVCTGCLAAATNDAERPEASAAPRTGVAVQADADDGPAQPVTPGGFSVGGPSFPSVGGPGGFGDGAGFPSVGGPGGFGDGNVAGFPSPGEGGPGAGLNPPYYGYPPGIGWHHHGFPPPGGYGDGRGSMGYGDGDGDGLPYGYPPYYGGGAAQPGFPPGFGGGRVPFPPAPVGGPPPGGGGGGDHDHHDHH